MTHGSLFAGIGGFDRGFERAGFRTLWAVEKEPFCRAVLATHFPETELLNDVHYCGQHNLRAVDVITAGFPCQDLSVAGKRAGLAGARSGLFWQVVRILGECRPPWFVLENVPGLFSSNEGRDFAVVLNELDELGYGLAWRVLDSQFFGVAQRRRRVFIVGRFGAPCPAEVLFESESSAGDFAESGEERQELASEIAASLRGSLGGRRGFMFDAEVGLAITPSNGHHGHSSPRGDGSDNLVACLNSGGSAGGFRTEPGEHIVIQDALRWRDKRQNGIGITEGGPCYTLDGTSEHAVAFAENQRGELRTSAIAPQLSAGGGKPGSGYSAVAIDEMARGQGWRRQGRAAERREEPDAGAGQRSDALSGNVSAPIDADGVRVPPVVSEEMDDSIPAGMDSARYRALGNAVTANVAYWIAKRIKPYLTGAL